MTVLLQDAGFGDVATWMGRYENRMTPEEFLAHRTSHGMSRRRFEALDESARESCIARVSERLRDLDPEDFVDRSDVVYAVGALVRRT